MTITSWLKVITSAVQPIRRWLTNEVQLLLRWGEVICGNSLCEFSQQVAGPAGRFSGKFLLSCVKEKQSPQWLGKKKKKSPRVCHWNNTESQSQGIIDFWYWYSLLSKAYSFSVRWTKVDLMNFKSKSHVFPPWLEEQVQSQQGASWLLVSFIFQYPDPKQSLTLHICVFRCFGYIWSISRLKNQGISTSAALDILFLTVPLKSSVRLTDSYADSWFFCQSNGNFLESASIIAMLTLVDSEGKEGVLLFWKTGTLCVCFTGLGINTGRASCNEVCHWENMMKCCWKFI